MKIHLLICVIIVSCGACSQIKKLDQVVPHADVNGRSVAAVEINSAPSAAWIYVDNVFIGTTPIVHEFNFDHSDRSIDVVAEPLPGNTAQMRQRRSFSLPPLPTRVHFNMNNPTRLSNYE
jgi:hypothetical protein